MRSLCLAVLLESFVLSAARPLSDGDSVGENIFLAPRSDKGNFFSSSSSSSSESILAPGSDGQFHRVVRELHSEEVNNGQEDRSRTAVVCIDGRCKQRVQRVSPGATETTALAPTVMESQDLPDEQQMMIMPRDMMQGFHDRMKDMMSEMRQPLAGVEDLGDAVDEDADDAEPSKKLDDTHFATANNFEDSFSKSYSYSNINGKKKEHVRVQRCHNGKCETAEQHGNGTPASSQSGVDTAERKVRDTPEGGILVAKETSKVE